jgi:2-polyprenyl-3-methyl-5-hydroxy-6-metoxy-1,4-benzoquinol methylase
MSRKENLANTVSKIEQHFADLFAEKFNEKKLRRWCLSRIEDSTWGLWSHILPFFKGNTILDLGCGLGCDCVVFAKLGYYVEGIDISPASIEKAKQFARSMGVAEKSTFKVANIHSNKLSGKFDIIFGRAILHHLTERPMRETVKTVKSLLKKEGRAVFIEPLDKNPFVNINRRFLDPYNRTPTEKPLNLKETVKTFKTSFNFVDHKELHLLSPAAHVFTRMIQNPLAFRITHNALKKVDELLLKNVESLKEFAWVTIIWCQ